MEEIETQLTAVTSAIGDSRPSHGLGVSLRSNNSEFTYLIATDIEEHAPMDWTPDEATQLLRERGYGVIGEWEDIDHTGGEDPTWKAKITELPCSRTHCYCN